MECISIFIYKSSLPFGNEILLKLNIIYNSPDPPNTKRNNEVSLHYLQTSLYRTPRTASKNLINGKRAAVIYHVRLPQAANTAKQTGPVERQPATCENKLSLKKIEALAC